MGQRLPVLLQRLQQQQQQQQQRVLLQLPVTLQYTLTQYPLSSKDNASTSSDILARRLPTLQQQQSSSPVLTSIHMKVNVAGIFRRCPLVGPHEVAQAVLSTARTRPRTSCCLRRRDGKECCLYTHNDTKALIGHLHTASRCTTHPRRFARNASCERSCFWRITSQAHQKKNGSCSSSTPHLIGHPARQHTWTVSWAWWTLW